MAKLPKRVWIGILILLLSLALLAFSFWPLGRAQLVVPLPTIESPPSTPVSGLILLFFETLL